MKNEAIMNAKATKFGILDTDTVKHIIDADAELYPNKVDRIDKFIDTVGKLKDHHADRFVDYEYEIDDYLADLFQTMLNVAYDMRNEATTGVVKSKRAEMLEKYSDYLSRVDTLGKLEFIDTAVTTLMTAATDNQVKSINLNVDFSKIKTEE